MSEKKKEKAFHAARLEREAHELRAEKKIDLAFHAFDKAGRLFREADDSFQAAVCFASAASCWNQHAGHLSHQQAASRNEYAAFEALKLKDYAYADSLFRQAALLYEKEGDYHRYSRCYLHAEDAHLARLWQIVSTGHVIHLFGDFDAETDVGINSRIKAFLYFAPGVLSKILWGYGEKPSRTLLFNFSLITVTAFIYDFSGMVKAAGDSHNSIHWNDALYFSIVTFTTVGYGDLVPLGWVRAVAGMEALAGMMLMPLFLIGLTRRYLRMHR